MPFQPGNTEGAKSRKAKPYADALRIAIMEADGDSTKLRRIADKHVELAMSGDMAAINAAADRLDGKVSQPVGGADDLPPIQGIAWLDSMKTGLSGSTTSPDLNSFPSTTEQNVLPASLPTAEPEKQ